MKKIILAFCFAATSCLVVSAQKYAIIDTRYILDKMPDYKTAQTQLDETAAQWQKDIDAMQTNLDKMYVDFDAEKVMLSDELKKKREDQLFLKEKELRDLLETYGKYSCTQRVSLQAMSKAFRPF